MAMICHCAWPIKLTKKTAAFPACDQIDRYNAQGHMAFTTFTGWRSGENLLLRSGENLLLRSGENLLLTAPIYYNHKSPRINQVGDPAQNLIAVLILRGMLYMQHSYSERRLRSPYSQLQWPP